MKTTDARFAEWDKEPLQPIDDHALILQKGEECYFSAPVVSARYKTVRAAAAYHGPVARVRLAKGVYYRAAILSATGASSEALVQDNPGTVYITNKRAIFRGQKRNTSAMLNKVLEVCFFYGDRSLRIDKDSGPPIFLFGFNDDKVLHVLHKVMPHEELRVG